MMTTGKKTMTEGIGPSSGSHFEGGAMPLPVEDSHMIDFGIPGDSLKLRRRTFQQLMATDETGYIDGATDFDLLIPFADDTACDTEARLWMAFLYGLSYSCTTVFRFQREFPTLDTVKPTTIKQFWTSNRDDLWFQPDRRYLKNNNQVIPAIKSIYQLSQGDLTSYLTPFLEQGFTATYKEIKYRWRFFGPMGSYLFFDALYGLLPDLYSDPKQLDWKHCGQTVPQGMAHLLGLDEQAIGQEPYDIPKYDKQLDSLAKRFNQPKIILESVLCMYRKLFKGTRYVGYYADRQLQECHATARLIKKHCGVNVWNYRERTCPASLRGEVNGWEGIRPKLTKLFLTTGKLTEEST